MIQLQATCDRFVAWHVGVAAALLVAGLLGADRWIATQLHVTGLEGVQLLLSGTVFLDTITGKDLSKFLPGLTLLVIGGGMAVPARTRPVARVLLFIGAVHLLAVVIAGTSKDFFGRLRPFELLETGDWARAWFAGGSSFPSGHAAFYFGLLMPVAHGVPRGRWALMLIPWFVALARVDANHHFLSDVAASILLVGLLTWGLARALGLEDAFTWVRRA